MKSYLNQFIRSGGKRKSRRVEEIVAHPTYYEKIEKDKQKKLLYEIIWQIGDMDDTGFETEYDDAVKAEAILKDFINHLEKLPYVCIVIKDNLENPE